MARHKKQTVVICEPGCVRRKGTKEAVGNGTALETASGLRKSDLVKRNGRWVSRKKSEQAAAMVKKRGGWPPTYIKTKKGAVKENCDASKGPITYVCGEESKGAHIVGRVRAMKRKPKSKAKKRVQRDRAVKRKSKAAAAA